MRPGVAAMVFMAATGPALAREPVSVCREPSVVDEITREVRSRDYYATVDPRLTTETRTADRSFVRCQVCVEAAPHDSTRADEPPLRRCTLQIFEIRILARGFVVRELN